MNYQLLTKPLRLALFESDFVKNVPPFVLQTTGCTIPLQKQPAVPFRHENVRHVYHEYCIRQGSRKTTYLDGSFQQRKKHETNEILTYKSKDKLTDTICTNINIMSLQVDTSKKLFIWHLLPVFFNNSIYGFGDLPQCTL